MTTNETDTPRIGVIGGSGLADLQALEIERQEIVTTPYGDASAPLTYGHFDELPMVFLPRHGPGHTIPPHKVNYRANIWALHQANIKDVIGMAAVGGITAHMKPGMICLPDQLIDYTASRKHTFYDEGFGGVTHIDFTYPYCDQMRNRLIHAAEQLGLEIETQGVYGATQGPRLETAAEIKRMEADGCDLVGMTGMPEASLAREMGICYASCSVVVNWAAGKAAGIITMEAIERNLATGMATARKLLSKLI